MKRKQFVGLLLPFGYFYGREILAGIIEFNRAFGNWRMADLGRFHADLAGANLAGLSGVIAMRQKSGAEQAIQERLKCPVVDVANTTPSWEGTRVAIDDIEAGRIGARHLAGLGFKHLVYYSMENYWCRLPFEGFSSEAEKLGCTATLLEGKSVDAGMYFLGSMYEDRHLQHQLSGLPRPAAIMACNDGEAVRIIDACRSCGLNVPGDVAVLGNGNDPLLCPSTHPELSSVQLPFKKLGYLAAETLSKLMAGKRLTRLSLVLPQGITIRQSTDTVAVTDPVVSLAVRIIRDQARTALSVAQVVDGISASGAFPRGISRSTLERRFQRSLGHSVIREIHNTKLGQAKQLLIETRLNVADIARNLGFSRERLLYELFKRYEGMPPNAFRAKHQLHGNR